MHKKGYFLINYIADLIGFDKPDKATKAFKFLKELIIALGLVISESKLYKTQKVYHLLRHKCEHRQRQYFYPRRETVRNSSNVLSLE